MSPRGAMVSEAAPEIPPDPSWKRPVRARADRDETRARILEVAEEHFRRIGYDKTSLADIASALGMSVANVWLQHREIKHAANPMQCPFRLLSGFD